MSQKAMLVLGMMSGTSADGIDVALARISGAPPNLSAKLIGHASVRFPGQLRKEILRVGEQLPISAGALSQLNFRLGVLFADAALAACRKFRVARGRISLIGSHGQTIFHQGWPVSCFGSPTASTLQIGEPSVIAARTGIATIGDFRPADMALGGQGAPLVPYVDYLLYRHVRLGRVSLNLGGIANITVLPRAAKPQQVFAFDTGPANMLIDALVSHFTRRQRFDKNAQLAAQGRSNPALLDEFLRDPYLKLVPPKSTGREYYGHTYLKKILALGRRHRAKPNDLIRAATIFTALSVVDALNRFVLKKEKIDQLIVSGGGAHNPLILAQLSAALPGIEVLPSSRLGVPEDAKEAFAFALLAYETFHQRPSNLPSATGARGPAILGKISYAPPR
ncbi:MAG TPA: anhydro-N-acetylmuramic acid kinase [Candidatus Polarisedimenticolia bacterium]|nr:anhydro-N-acetylmuramic acid kinase [Candidatus Polarisedimenticolia bacterium]